MRESTRIVVTWFGVLAGLAGLEHGIFEILQRDLKPGSLMFPSMGPPCVPEATWNACEPAMSILPNFLITGIIAVIFGLVIVIWSATFARHRQFGIVLIVLSIVLLLFGGGFFPPVIALVAGAAGMKIHKPIVARQVTGRLSFEARLWPWPLVIFVVWVLGQFPVGYFFNDSLKNIMGFGVFLILTMLPLSIYAAYAHDVTLASKGA